jgi:pilus assembly protein Flp/PilA
MLKLLAFKDAYLRDTKGATAIEYGLIAAGIAVAIVAVVFLVGDELDLTFTTVQEKLAEANAQ